MKKFSIFILLISLLPVLGFSQGVPGGLEALTITESANGDKTYSLSLKILALMTALTILPSFGSRYDSFYKNNNCNVNFKASSRYTTNSTKSNYSSYFVVSDFFCNGPYFQ